MFRKFYGNTFSWIGIHLEKESRQFGGSGRAAKISPKERQEIPHSLTDENDS
jgi:hypothetical protein